MLKLTFASSTSLIVAGVVNGGHRWIVSAMCQLYSVVVCVWVLDKVTIASSYKPPAVTCTHGRLTAFPLWSNRATAIFGVLPRRWICPCRKFIRFLFRGSSVSDTMRGRVDYLLVYMPRRGSARFTRVFVADLLSRTNRIQGIYKTRSGQQKVPHFLRPEAREFSR